MNIIANNDTFKVIENDPDSHYLLLKLDFWRIEVFLWNDDYQDFFTLLMSAPATTESQDEKMRKVLLKFQSGKMENYAVKNGNLGEQNPQATIGKDGLRLELNNLNFDNFLEILSSLIVKMNELFSREDIKKKVLPPAELYAALIDLYNYTINQPYLIKKRAKLIP